MSLSICIYEYIDRGANKWILICKTFYKNHLSEAAFFGIHTPKFYSKFKKYFGCSRLYTDC